MLTLREKKAYLIDVSFKFNEIKFYTLLMNWLIWKKMFTYFYNKFTPVNRMYYIQCGVNGSLHNSGCCVRSVAPWVTVLSWHTVFTKRVMYYKFTFVWYSAKQGTTHRATSHLVHCVPFLWLQEEHRRQRSWVDWPVFGMVTSAEACCCFCCFCCCCGDGGGGGRHRPPSSSSN